jgi:DNA polymerase-3 subunit beta
LDADISDQGSTTVYAKKLSEVIRALPANDDIEIGLGDENFLNVRSKSKTTKANIRIKCIPKEDYPVLPEFKEEKKISIPQKVLKDMIRKTIFSVSKDEIQGTISGIKLELKDKKLRLVATDARRLALMDYNTDSDETIEEVIIPQKVLSEVQKILTEEGEVLISVSEKQIYFKMDNVELMSRLIDGKFPDYNQVIPNSFEKKIILGTEQVYSAIKVVSPMASEKQTSKIILKFSTNNLEVIANDPDMGDAKESVDIIYDLEEFEIAFSSEFLLDAFKSIDSEKVFGSFNNNTSAALLKEENNEDFVCLIMPIRMT